MEDLQSLMSCLDDISSKIPDGIYLEMADKMKRINDHLTGNKPFHEDPFYYSTDEEDSNSDDETPNYDPTRLREIARLRDEILASVKQMHEDYEVLERWEDQLKRCIEKHIERMTAHHKREAIKTFCKGCYMSGVVEDDSALVGCLSEAGADHCGSWTWKNLVEYGLRAIVMEIGTEDEIEKAKRNYMYYDDISLKTLQKLPAFEKNLYKKYKENSNQIWLRRREEAVSKVTETKEKMLRHELACREREDILRELSAPIFTRDHWITYSQEGNDDGDFFAVGERMVDGP
jgi:hypothetical protein